MNATSQLPTVLQLDIMGNPQKWITYQDSAYYIAKDCVAWSMGEVEFDLHGGINAITGERSIMTINTIIAIKGHLSKKAMAHYNRVPLSNRTLFRRDQHTCCYCLNTLPASKLTRDHIHPTSRGGLNVWENVVASCSPCNKLKGNKLLKDINMELHVIPYAPNRSEWLILQHRNILADQMKFLVERVSSNSRFKIQ